jgi:hypothetical protein
MYAKFMFYLKCIALVIFISLITLIIAMIVEAVTEPVVINDGMETIITMVRLQTIHISGLS